MTTWINSQFPRPDFHRQVQRHYGLQDTGFPPRRLSPWAFEPGKTTSWAGSHGDDEMGRSNAKMTNMVLPIVRLHGRDG